MPWHFFLLILYYVYANHFNLLSVFYMHLFGSYISVVATASLYNCRKKN